MPRTAKSRMNKHGQAVQLPSKRAFAVPDSQVDEAIVPGEDVGSAANISTDIGPSDVSFSKLKKGRLPASQTVPDLIIPHPYSRSHIKREKRKAKQNLAGGDLAQLSTALSEAAGDSSTLVPPSSKFRGEPVVQKPAREEKKKDTSEKGKIGEGKGRTMTENARRKQIALEAKRIPAIMKHPAYKASPWATIRLHASNSLATVPQVGKKKSEKGDAGGMDLE